MREKLNVLYYPDSWVDYPTLVKSVLLFDELHFMDRPAMTFGQFGTVGAASALRQYEESFREEGVPLYVHAAPGGIVDGEWLEQIVADVNDPEFLNRYQLGLTNSPTFRRLQVARGNYGEFGDQDAVAARLMNVDLTASLANRENAMHLFNDPAVHVFDLSSPAGCAKNLISGALTCSAKLNFALTAGTKEGFLPLADANPYGDLLGAKYARAIDRLGPGKNSIQLTDLSFAIFEEIFSSERLKALNLKEVVDYRKASASGREAFLDHLTVLQAKQSSIGTDGDYAGAISKIITTEILPAARTFKNKLKSIDERLVGDVAKGVVGAAGGSSLVQLFAGLSWPTIIPLAGMAAAYGAKATIDAILANRAAKRECSISYILSLDS